MQSWNMTSECDILSRYGPGYIKINGFSKVCLSRWSSAEPNCPDPQSGASVWCRVVVPGGVSVSRCSA